ncbi:hypothetical protein B9Q02_07130 [Candidatus Marsarchaeota G1 archaeon BE_D]|jgi:hypothetical protein|nr:MAG: hypothetical protein B9Q02_07130 [Candidatus Marsarchaeota G1 archaeon BE_D]PSO05445.1 MAG: hypothetical protein B9Q12_00450 [Candidatus Marsarchaeota G2 archaeon ECH_B_SAG-G06]
MQKNSSVRDTLVEFNDSELRASLRVLRKKAIRLRLWLSALSDTERGLLNASLCVEKIGLRLRFILSGIVVKLRKIVQEGYFLRLEQLGLESARRLVEFFYGSSEKAKELLQDRWFLRYHGLRMETLKKLGYAL